jgi:hypothetical protein
MKRFLPLALLAAASPAMAARYAVLVGVDQYGFIKEPSRQLRGSTTDVGLMKRMLDLYGFDSVSLVQKDASRKRIVEELAKLEAKVQADDQVVFYFSGRGSIVPSVDAPTAKTGFEPTLVPSDGSATATDLDIRMRRIEDWARNLVAKRAEVTVILDTSFQNPTRSDFGRQYNPIPRSIQRAATASGEVRDELYKGPGLFLSACPAKGSAYEWLVNSGQQRWAGAFTDQFVNAVVAALNRGDSPTPLDAMREVQAYFKDKIRADYMPGLSPYPAMEALSTDRVRYEAPLLGGVSPANLPPDSKAALAAMEKARQERERKFRVALEVEDAGTETQRKAAHARIAKDLQRYLTSKVVNSEFAPEGAPPDVIVKVKAAKSSVEATVTGDDLDKTKSFTFRGRDLSKALDAGLGNYLELRSLVMRMQRLTATEEPTWDVSTRLTADGALFSRGDRFTLDVEAPAGALLFILNRDDSDGVLQIAFPQVGAPYKQKLTGPIRLSGRLKEDTSSGRMMLRAIVVPSEGRTKIAEASMADERKFREELLRQLRIVVAGMEKKQIPWIAKTIDIRIR